MTNGGLVGRQLLTEQLAGIFAQTAAGNGSIVLLGGEAGVGKTRLATTMLEQSGLVGLRVTAGPATASPFGLIVGALRAYMHIDANGFRQLLQEPLGRLVPLLMPELGQLSPAEVDQATLFEVARNAFTSIARHAPTVVFLDDLQEADHATLELLPYLASATEQEPLFLLAAYRTDELRRDHPVRRLRTDLRRAGRLREFVIQALSGTDTAALAEQILGGPTSPSLAATLYERTDGLPLFIEELVEALSTAGRLRHTDGVWQLVDPAAPLPGSDTIRDLVLLRATRLSAGARSALEVAVVAGVRFSLDLVTTLVGGEDMLTEAFTQGLLIETADADTAAFRHAMTRDALYGTIAWPRRRALHRQVANELERRGGTPGVVAEHWLASREPERARRALLLAADAACRVHAYRDAAGFTQRALELWPDGALEPERLATLDRLGHCAQLSGDLSSAAAAWSEVAEVHGRAGDARAHAEAQRRLAGVYELQGSWQPAMAAHQTAADAFAASERPGDAAAERIEAANHMRLAGSFASAMHLLVVAAEEAHRAERIDLQARILGLEGNIRVHMGDGRQGVEQARRGLSLALEHNLSGPAAEVYRRLANALEQAGDYPTARETYLEAADFCQTHGAEATAQFCLACMAVVLRQTGDWDRCVQVCSEVLASDASPGYARAVAICVLGLVRVQRGDAARARPLLLEAARSSVKLAEEPLECACIWGLAMSDVLDGQSGTAAKRCQLLLERWRHTHEPHYILPPLRWAVGLFAARHDDTDARACANALAQIVADTGASEAVAALGHALGELSLLDDDPARAVSHFTEALELLAALELPYERAHTCLRAGWALVAAGERDRGVQRLVDSYRIARSLGARPLAEAASRELERLGEPVDRRLGRRAAGLLQRGGLTRRELEVLGLVAEGHTDREIARTLVLSPRTIEMHVANSLSKLGCRSRAQAVRRAAELQLLAAVEPPRKRP